MPSASKNIWHSTIKAPKKVVLQQKASISEAVETMQALVAPPASITTTLLPDNVYQVPASVLTYLVQSSLVAGGHPGALIKAQPGHFEA